MKIVEGVAGVWHYHFSESGLNGKPALCGEKNVMQTEVPLTTWGGKGHLNETYCKECENIFFTGNIGKRCMKAHRDNVQSKPFKSSFLLNTIKGVIDHPILHIPAYTFEEDDSYVECRRCVII